MRSRPKGAAPRNSVRGTSGAATRPNIAAMASALIGIAPHDAIERMMAAELIAAHSAVMECYRRARVGDHRQRHQELRNANRLSRAFVLLVNALHRYRSLVDRRGEPRALPQDEQGDQGRPDIGHHSGEGVPEKIRGTTPCNAGRRPPGHPASARVRPARLRLAKACASDPTFKRADRPAQVDAPAAAIPERVRGTDARLGRLADASRLSSPALSGRSSSPSVGMEAWPHRLAPPSCGVLDGPLEAGHDSDEVALDLARTRVSAQKKSRNNPMQTRPPPRRFGQTNPILVRKTTGCHFAALAPQASLMLRFGDGAAIKSRAGPPRGEACTRSVLASAPAQYARGRLPRALAAAHTPS